MSGDPTSSSNRPRYDLSLQSTTGDCTGRLEICLDCGESFASVGWITVEELRWCGTLFSLSVNHRKMFVAEDHRLRRSAASRSSRRTGLNALCFGAGDGVYTQIERASLPTSPASCINGVGYVRLASMLGKHIVSIDSASTTHLRTRHPHARIHTCASQHGPQSCINR